MGFIRFRLWDKSGPQMLKSICRWSIFVRQTCLTHKQFFSSTNIWKNHLAKTWHKSQAHLSQPYEYLFQMSHPPISVVAWHVYTILDYISCKFKLFPNGTHGYSPWTLDCPDWTLFTWRRNVSSRRASSLHDCLVTHSQSMRMLEQKVSERLFVWSSFIVSFLRDKKSSVNRECLLVKRLAKKRSETELSPLLTETTAWGKTIYLWTRWAVE